MAQYETFFSVEFRFVENLEPLMLSIEKFTTFGDIIEVLNARQAFLTTRFSRENFGLFLSVEDKWASPSEALAVYSFEGEVREHAADSGPCTGAETCCSRWFPPCAALGRARLTSGRYRRSFV